MWNDDVEISLCRPAESMDYFFRNGEGDEVIFVHEGSGTLETIFGDLPYTRGRLRRRPARHDVPLQARGAAAPPRVRDARADRDPAPLPQRLRAARSRARRTTTATSIRRPSCSTVREQRRVPGQGARARRLPDLRRRLPPVRRRRLGRLPLPVDVLDPRLRADHRPHPPAAAVAPDLPGPELRHLLVLPAQARLRPARRCRSRTTTRTCSRRR